MQNRELRQNVPALLEIVGLVGVQRPGEQAVDAGDLVADDLAALGHDAAHDSGVELGLWTGLVALGSLHGVGQDLVALVPVLHELLGQRVELGQPAGLRVDANEELAV